MNVRLVLFVAGICLGLPLLCGAEPSIRVRIVEDAASVVLSGRALQVENRAVSEKELHATARAGRVYVAHLTSPRSVRVSAADGVVVDGHRFPGGVALVPRGDDRMDVINEVPLEHYVARAMAGEVYADWPLAALDAQAVVTRSYALYYRARRMGQAYHLEASVVSQHYASGTIPARIEQAARATRNEVLVFRGKPILAAYHASAGGRTASSSEVWGLRLPYLETVLSPDDESPHFFWSYEIPFSALVQAVREAGLEPGSARAVRVERRSPSGRVARLRVGEACLSGRELRQILGGRAIHSSLFDVRWDGANIRFLGSGSGHGVGLSQWGAREMARRGSDYREILAHYYPGTRLQRLEEPRPVEARP